MFKIFGGITILAVVTNLAATVERLNNDSVNGILIDRAYINGILPFYKADGEVLVCPTNGRGNICANDCKTLLACASNSSTPLFASKCSDLAPVVPYCIPGRAGCSIVGDSNNSQCAIAASTSFTCTNVGYFPDASNCALYHVCTEETQETYQCPPLYVFDPTNLKCKRRRGIRDCRRINCVRSVNKYVVYPGRKSYYAYCSTTETIMFRCEDADNFEFNPISVNCEFACKAEGWYPNYKDCQQYYECYRGLGHRFTSRVQTCPKSMIFDVTIGRCVKGECPTTLAPSTTETATDTNVDTTTPIVSVSPDDDTTTLTTVSGDITTDTITTDTTTTDSTTTDTTTTDTSTTVTTTTDSTTDTSTTDTTISDTTTTDSTTDTTATGTTTTDPTTTDTTITDTTTTDIETTVAV